MTATAIERRPIPKIADDPIVQAHRRQRADLEQALAEAKANHARLLTEREQAAAAAVDGLLESAAADNSQRQVDIDAELARTAKRITALDEALERHGQIEKRARSQAQGAIRREIREQARTVVEQMIPVVEQLEALNSELATLYAAGGGAVQIGVVPYRSAVLSSASWLGAARAFVAERES